MTAFPIGKQILKDKKEGSNLKALFTAITEEALDLLLQCLTFNPLQRLSATEALAHAFFKDGPAPTPPHKLPIK